MSNRPFNGISLPVTMVQPTYVPPQQRVTLDIAALSLKEKLDLLNRVDDALGYHRFVLCNDCNNTFKLYICYSASDKSCNPEEETHTHMDCKCENRRIKLLGEVQFKTRKNKKQYDRKVEISEKELRELRAIAAAAKVEEAIE